MLKKFDSGLRENVFSVNPQHEAISRYIVDDLQDSLSITGVAQYDNWNALSNLLKGIKDVEPAAKSA